MADDKEKFIFDLDTTDAIKGAEDLRQKILSVGDVKNVAPLLTSLGKIGIAIGIVSAAAVAFKVAMDLTLEGEKILQIGRNFKAIAEDAGQSSESIKSGISSAVGDIVDMEDALLAANKAMLQLGSNSNRIPEMFELARKASYQFGGEITDIFEKISQAAATGNTRQLKSIGLIIDSEKAYRDYAKSIGTVVKALTDEQRQTAITEAILTQGSQKLKNVTTDNDNLTNSLKKLTVAIDSVKDGFALMFEKAFGGVLADLTKKVAELAATVGDKFTAAYGKGNDALEARLRLLQAERKEEIDKRNFLKQSDEEVAQRLAGLDTHYGIIFKRREDEIALLKSQIQHTNELAEMEQAHNQAVEAKSAAKDTGASEEARAIRAKFESDLLAMKQSRIAQELRTETEAEAYRNLLLQQRENTEAQYEAKIADIRIQGELNQTISKSQADQMIVQLEAEKQSKIMELQRATEQAALQGYENQVQAAQTDSQGITAAFAQGAAQAQASLKNYGANGQMVFKTLTSNAANAFRALGDGSKSAGDAMKGFLFGSIADVSEAKGQFLLASGIGTGDGVEIAQGGALIALAGLLRSQADGAGSSVGGVSGGGGGGAGSAPGGMMDKPELEEQKKKSVTVQFNGPYFETEQTKRRLMELIREESDATDFKYDQIGVS